MNFVIVVLVIAVIALWLRQLRFERSINAEVKRVEEDSGPTYYR